MPDCDWKVATEIPELSWSKVLKEYLICDESNTLVLETWDTSCLLLITNIENGK